MELPARDGSFLSLHLAFSNLKKPRRNEEKGKRNSNKWKTLTFTLIGRGQHVRIGTALEPERHESK